MKNAIFWDVDLGERDWGGTDWIDLAQDRTSSRESSNIPSDSIQCLEVLE
jgi:hypothetical protein